MTQFATEGSLREILQERGVMPNPDVRTILLGIARGVCYLHEEKSVMHRDLKTAKHLDGEYARGENFKPQSRS